LKPDVRERLFGCFRKKACEITALEGLSHDGRNLTVSEARPKTEHHQNNFFPRRREAATVREIRGYRMNTVNHKSFAIQGEAIALG